jgi:protein TonB
MLRNLVESKPRNSRRTAGTLLSFMGHYGLILFVIYTSAQAETLADGPKQEKVEFVETKTDEPPPKKVPPLPEQASAPRPVKTIKVLIAPVEIASVLPDIDLTQRVTDPDDFVRRGSPTVASTDSATALRPSNGEAYAEREVEKPVMQAPNSAAPVYPDILRQAGVEGEALVSFVVDTTGRVEIGSFRVIRTTHELFIAAVRNALPRMRFIPAEVGSNKVRQLVQQPYSFAIVK